MSDEYSGPRRWPWVLLALGVIFLLLLVGGHWIWSSGAGRRLNAQVALYKSAGEPIEPADFGPTDLRDEDNAAIDLRKAARSIDMTTAAWKEYDKLEAALPLTDKEIAAITAIVAANRSAFDDVDTAMTKKGVDWKLAIRSPTIQVLLPDLNQQRMLARLIYHRALLHHQQGDDAAALRDLHRVEFLANAVNRQPFLVCYLVGTGMRTLVAGGVEAMAPQMKIGAASGAASRQQVSQTIATLLDEREQWQALRRGLLGERMAQLDTARCVADGTINLAMVGGMMRGPTRPVALLNFLARPIALDDGLLMIRHTTALMKAVEKSNNWPAYKEIAPPMPPQVNQNRIRHVLAAMMMPAFDRPMQTNFKAVIERRMAAISLAIRAYRLDHDGALPAKLDDLVPGYLPAVPLDAMTSNAPIKYLPRADKPIVYSVGEDGIDQGGSEVNSIDTTYSRWKAQDAVTHLTRQPREAPQDPQFGPEGIDPLPQSAPASQPAATAAAATQPVTP